MREIALDTLLLGIYEGQQQVTVTGLNSNLTFIQECPHWTNKNSFHFSRSTSPDGIWQLPLDNNRVG